MSTCTYVHDAIRLEVTPIRRLENTNSYSRKVTVTDSKGGWHEFNIFADEAAALAMPGDVPAPAEDEAA